MTLSALRVRLRGELAEAASLTGLDIDTSFEADEILRHFTGLFRAGILLHGDREADDALCKQVLSVSEQRKAGEPLAYLLGEVSFFGFDFSVRRGCLIPRADTEVLVEEAVGLLPPDGVLWDLCTGTGCIPCAVLLARKDLCSAYGVELYPDALAAAEENRIRHGLAGRFSVTHGDVLAGAVPRSPDGSPARRPFIITSNPPYIASSVCETLDIQVRKEPLTALDGGPDGLLFYRAILSRYAEHLLPGGHFLFEIGYDQGDALRALAFERGFSCRIRKDYAGLDRVAVLSSAL